MNNTPKMIQFKNQRYKIVQEYQQEYQSQLIELETQLLNSALFYNHAKEYLNYQTEKLKRDINSNMSAFRSKLIQHRQRSSTAKHSIGVSPEPYLDVISNPFNTREWNHLSLGTIVFLRHLLLVVSASYRSVFYTFKSECYSSSKTTRNRN